jgi:hypothetical protein
MLVIATRPSASRRVNCGVACKHSEFFGFSMHPPIDQIFACTKICAALRICPEAYASPYFRATPRDGTTSVASRAINRRHGGINPHFIDTAINNRVPSSMRGY